MIELKHINKSYFQGDRQVQALHQVSLKVPAGKIHGIIGRSGAGKSSLIRCVNFLERPDAGEVWIKDVALHTLTPPELRAQRRQIGMIFQQFNLLSSATVYDNIALPLKVLRAAPRTIQLKVERLLKLTGLEDKAESYPAQLSGGQKQRVAIARALVTDPDILLCDEATSSLDPETTESILLLLKTLQQELGLTILAITHEMEVVKNFCDTVSVLDKGRIVEENTVFKLFTQPQTTIAKNLIAGTLKLNLPEVILDSLELNPVEKNGIPVLRIRFVGEETTEPILSSLAVQCGVGFNILQANIELVQQQRIGTLIMEMMGEPTAIQQGIAYLETQGLGVEIIGYAQHV